MAESVDASVSNTDGETRAGSTPAPGTIKSCKLIEFQTLTGFLFTPPPRFDHLCTTFLPTSSVFLTVSEVLEGLHMVNHRQSIPGDTALKSKFFDQFLTNYFAPHTN